MIKHDRSVWINPYRDHTRLNGLQRGRQDWSDLQDTREQLETSAGIVNALVLGLAVWGVLGIIAALIMGWLE